MWMPGRPAWTSYSSNTFFVLETGACSLRIKAVHSAAHCQHARHVGAMLQLQPHALLQVASLAITELYLSNFRLVWRCLVGHLQHVFDNTWMLATASPSVVVDAVRSAKLLDAVMTVRSSSPTP
jgi:hypothetical protein